MAKVLIVDDQKSVLMTLQSILGGKGHYVVTATSTFEALEKVANQKLDLIITDAVMPGGLSGFELARNLKNSKDYKEIPIILLTGKRDQSDVERAINIGVSDYIIKPIDPDILIAKVNSILKQVGKPQAHLVECAIQARASIEDETQIINISEVGMTLLSNVSAAVGANIKVNSDIFDEIGIGVPFLRVVSSEGPTGEKNLYKIQIQFVGFSEKQFQPIRLFIASKSR